MPCGQRTYSRSRTSTAPAWESGLTQASHDSGKPRPAQPRTATSRVQSRGQRGRVRSRADPLRFAHEPRPPSRAAIRSTSGCARAEGPRGISRHSGAVKATHQTSAFLGSRAAWWCASVAGRGRFDWAGRDPHRNRVPHRARPGLADHIRRLRNLGDGVRLGEVTFNVGPQNGRRMDRVAEEATTLAHSPRW
jgi:hypothetical protein